MMCGASAAFHVSDIPMEAPIAGVRIARLDGEFLINPSMQQTADADLVLVVAGSRDGISMVEGGAKELGEEIMMEAMELAFVEIQKIIGAIEELREKAGIDKFALSEPVKADESVYDRVGASGCGGRVRRCRGQPAP